MLKIDAPELTRMLLLLGLEKLPSTRKGEGYYIEDIHRKTYINDLIDNLRKADTLGWESYYGEYKPTVGDSKRYEIARVIIDHHIQELRYAGNGKRLAKNAKEQFVNNIVADFHVYGLFNQQKKELTCKVAKILVSVVNEDISLKIENKDF